MQVLRWYGTFEARVVVIFARFFVVLLRLLLHHGFKDGSKRIPRSVVPRTGFYVPSWAYLGKLFLKLFNVLSRCIHG